MDEAQTGDAVVVWRLDRLGRSLIHVVQTVNDFKTRGINFISLSEVIDTTSAMGEFTFHLMAALAHLESRIISERTIAGMGAARVRGRHLGRKRSPPHPATARVNLLRQQGMSIREIAAAIPLDRGKVHRILQTLPAHPLL